RVRRLATQGLEVRAEHPQRFGRRTRAEHDDSFGSVFRIAHPDAFPAKSEGHIANRQRQRLARAHARLTEQDQDLAIGWRRRGDGSVNGGTLVTRRYRAWQAPASVGRFARRKRMGRTELMPEWPSEEAAEGRGAGR